MAYIVISVTIITISHNSILAICYVHACIILFLIVPGLTGSQLDVKDDDPSCTTFGDFFGLWVDPYRFLDIGCTQRELE